VVASGVVGPGPGPGAGDESACGVEVELEVAASVVLVLVVLVLVVLDVVVLDVVVVVVGSGRPLSSGSPPAVATPRIVPITKAPAPTSARPLGVRYQGRSAASFRP